MYSGFPFLNKIFMRNKRGMHVLLNSELQEHLKILNYFKPLPKAIREYILTECGTGYYKLFEEKEFSPMTNCFMCCHNYYQLKFQMPSPVNPDVSDISDLSDGFQIP